MIQSFMRTVRAGRKQVLAFLLASFIGAAVLAPCASMAQNLGTVPATGQAVQGQTAAQPEGAFLNAVNWLCNVICPVGAGIAVVATGSAALGSIAERPELFGRSLVYVGLAEGIAIYGLIVSVLILGRI